jgi:hypothetical protein
MKQSKGMSLLESGINIGVGFGISLGAQMVFLPMIGVPINHTQNFIFACIMTVISLARSFLLRRLFEALHIRVPLSAFILACIAERRRQESIEGWTPEHDDKYDPGELARAGAAYAVYAKSHIVEKNSSGVFALALQIWPWTNDWWKPAGFRRDLVKAGALIFAEGEKFDRTKGRRS